MKKKILSAVLVFCMLFGSAAALPEGVFETSSTITASAFLSGDYEYKVLKDGTAEITKYSGDAENVTIPSMLGGKKVTSIGERAFARCSSITSITIPSSVTSIGYHAFSGTEWLEDQQKKDPLVVVNGILIDGENCEGNVLIPSNVKSICERAFSGNESLTSVTIPNSVTCISDSMFYGCKSLTSVTISKGVTSIGDGAFSYCKSLSSVKIPSGVTSIGRYAFHYCERLTSISIPNSVTSIGEGAFYSCRTLTSVTIPKGVTNIEHHVFDGCVSLTSVTIPNSVKSIGKDAFVSCYGLKSVIIPSSVTSISSYAFGLCESLTSVIIPGSVTSIGSCAFYGCTSLKSLTIHKGVESIGYSAFVRCTSLTNVTIPSSVTVVGKEAFLDCTSLKTVTIPESVTMMGKDAFGYYNKASDGVHERNKVKDFTIRCYKGSTAEKYAKDNGFKFVSLGTIEPTTTRLAGANRYETASIISKKMNPKTSDTVIIATGLTFHDAMVAVPLASAYNAPLLLATEKHITAQTEAELKRLGAKNVIVVSTNGAIGAKAKAEFKAKKLNMTYIEGKTCFETAAKVAKALQAKTKKAPDTIFFATDSAFADALSASPVAAIKNAPIMYLKNTGSIDSATANYLKSVKGKVKNAYIIGGDGVISNAMMKNVANALGLTVNKTVQRVAGKNRYETCVAVNNKFKSVLTGDGICVAKGLDFPDALAGGVYAAATKQALFLADGKKLQDYQNTYLKGKNASKITIFGGTGAVPDELVKTIAQASV